MLDEAKYMYVLFDDTVLDKRHAKKIEMAQRQYSGNEHGVVQGIGLVNCIYVNLLQTARILGGRLSDL